MKPALDFKGYCRHYFARLCRGYVNSLDDTLVRAHLPGHRTAIDAGGSYDACARFLPAIAAWLTNPQRFWTFDVRGTAIDMESLARAVLENAFDPEHPGFWGRDELPNTDERTVDASVVAYSAWLLSDTLLPTISGRAFANLQAWLTHFAAGPLSMKGNWNLFWIVNHAGRKALGWDYSQEIIDEAWRRINALDRDGWMTDGEEGCFDDYNWWVFALHELMWLQIDGASNADLAKVVGDRIRGRLESYPCFFAADGSYTEFGRSLAYKFARLACPILAYKLGLWPHSPGLLKRIIRLHLSHYDELGAIDPVSDTIRQTLSAAGSPAVRDPYISTGHPYWSMLTFAALWQLDESDPLWKADEEPLPIEQADFTRTIRPAGWILIGIKATGQLNRHALGSRGGHGEFAAKYAKFLYSSQFPVNVGSVEGDFGPDCALCLSDGQHWAHPELYDSFVAGDDYMRARYVLRVGQTSIACETILIPHGEGAVRIHRLRIPKGNSALTIHEGGAPLGYAPGEMPAKRVDAAQQTSTASLGARTSLIRGIAGYTAALLPQGFRGRDALNAIHAHAVTPVLESTVPAGFGRDLVLACWAMATTGSAGSAEITAEWRADDSVRALCDGRAVIVPAMLS